MLQSQVIVRLIQMGKRFHVLAQGFSGKIYHEVFDSEEGARAYLKANTNLIVKLERV